MFRKKLAAPFGFASMIALSAFALPGSAKAELVGTGDVIGNQRAAEQRERVQDFLLRGDVKAQMEALGVSAEEAQSRVNTLSQTELAEINGQLEAMPAGQSIGLVGLVLIVLLLVIIL